MCLLFKINDVQHSHSTFVHCLVYDGLDIPIYNVGLFGTWEQFCPDDFPDATNDFPRCQWEFKPSSLGESPVHWLGSQKYAIVHSVHMHHIVHSLIRRLCNWFHPTKFILFTVRLPWQPAGIIFTQCVNGQKSAFSSLQEKLCTGSKNDCHVLELSQRSLSACKVWGRWSYTHRL